MRVLVHRDRKKRPEEFADPLEVHHKFNMHDQHDEGGADVFFKGAEWADFDENWLAEMDAPDSVDEEEEEAIAQGRMEFPTHDDAAVDPLFELTLKQYRREGEVEFQDPRAQGPLGITDYQGAMDEWIQDNKRITWLDIGKKKGTLTEQEKQQVPNTSVNEDHVFSADSSGVFLTVLQSKKATNFLRDYEKGFEEAHQELQKRVRFGEEEFLAPELPEGEENPFDEESESEEEKMDVETIVSTYTNTENRPTVIGIEKKRKATTPTPTPSTKQQDTPAVDDDDNNSAVGEEEEEEEDDMADRLTWLTIATSTTSKRDPNETPEERRQRKGLVKEMRKLKRIQKKEMKVAFKTEEQRQRKMRPQNQMQRKTVSLSNR
eukprot:TRINITY_DN48859_c1_g1_i1.p1 TRINITY_DN48859_c1_g1~~TRINITY_DN48859_c1_g1_i1.p1  ORF type:complete len:420 (+),score=76.07 TRINITY_DN48859_c1_g1_i1:135-1262(+)